MTASAGILAKQNNQMQSFYCTNVYVTGPKDVIGRMLAAVKRNVGDSIPVAINLPDLLDEEGRKDSQVLEKQRAFEANQEDDDNEKMINLVKVTERGADSTICFQLSEESYYCEWLSWEDISRIYGVRIFEDVYDSGAFEQFQNTIIIEPDGDTTKKTLIDPQHSLNQYEQSFDELIELDPERYREVKIGAMEDLISRIQYDLDYERVRLVVERTKADNGNVFIPKEVTHISRFDFQGCEIKSISVHPDNPAYCAEGNCLLDKDKTTVIIGCDHSVVPESVKEMTPDAFSGCSCEPLMKERFPVESPDDWINGLF